MNDTIKAAIAAHAIAEYPRECCGLVIEEFEGEVYVRVRIRPQLPPNILYSPQVTLQPPRIGARSSPWCIRIRGLRPRRAWRIGPCVK